MNVLRSPLPVLLGLLLAGSVAASASSITYYFQGTLPYDGFDMSVQGSFALDLAIAPNPVGSVSDFHFDASANGSTLTMLDSTAGDTGGWAYDDSGNIGVEFLSQDDSFTLLLDFANLPGPLNLQPFSVAGSTFSSGLVSFVGTQQTESVFTSGEADTTPEPASWTLMLGGLLAGGLGWSWRRRAAGLQA
jgi:hypothetical protein